MLKKRNKIKKKCPERILTSYNINSCSIKQREMLIVETKNQKWKLE